MLQPIPRRTLDPHSPRRGAPKPASPRNGAPSAQSRESCSPLQGRRLAYTAIVGALVEARRRGVDVRVILPTRNDSGFMNTANLIAASVFLRNGIRVYAYPGMTHVKAAIYDGWATVGSANFDKLSLRINQETNLATSDPRFVEQLKRDLFERDFTRSREMKEPPRAGLGCLHLEIHLRPVVMAGQPAGSLLPAISAQ